MSDPLAVIEGREPLMVFTIHTDGGPRPVGRLWCKNGRFSFDGNMELSGQIFVDYICDRLNNPKKYGQGS